MSAPDNRVKILFLSHDAEWGGAQTLLYVLVKGIDPQKYKSLVVLPKPGRLEKRLKNLGIQTKLLPLEWATGSTKTDWAQYTRFNIGLRTRVNEIVKLIRQEQIDLVFTNTGVILEGALAARLCGVPHVWHILEIFSLDPKLFPILDLPQFYTLLNDLSDKLVVGSKAVQAEIQQFIQSEKIEIIYAGVELPTLENIHQDKSKLLGFQPDTPTVCFVGLLSKRKGVLNLVDTAEIVVRKFPQVKFVMVGQDDGVLAEMRKQIAEKKLTQVFELLGFRTDYLDIVASSDLLVLPSLIDTLPLIVLDAMKVCKPVVATQCGGIGEMVLEGETGLLVPVNDPAAMAQAIISLLENPGQSKTMGERGRQRIETVFSCKQFVTNFECIFDQITSHRKSDADQSNAKLIDAFLAMLELADTAKTNSYRPQQEPTSSKRPFERPLWELPIYKAYEIKPLQLETDQKGYQTSVCIPTYNGAKYLAEAISSILNQTFSDFELIIVDDCSTDATEAVIQSFADPRLKYFRNSTRLGLVGNWNKCLELSTSPYVYIFHQDDIMLPENLAQKYKILEENPTVGLVYSNVFIVDASGKVTAKNWFFKTQPDTDFIMPGLEFFEMLISGFNIISCPGVMVRRECYEKLGGFDSRLPFSADWEMWLRIALFSDVTYIAKPLIKYRYHDSNETHNFKGLSEVEQYYQAKMIALEKYPGRVPHDQSLKSKIAAEYEKKGLGWAFDYYHHQHYEAAEWALEFAMNVHARAIMEDNWHDEYKQWFLKTVTNMHRETLSPSAQPFPSVREIIYHLSGEDIARQIPVRKLIKAVGFKLAKQPGFRWLYRYRDLGKKILGP